MIVTYARQNMFIIHATAFPLTSKCTLFILR
jgi:hypothetical protein